MKFMARFTAMGVTTRSVRRLGGVLLEIIQVPLIGSHGEDLPQSAGMAFEAVRSTTQFWRYARSNPYGRSWSESRRGASPPRRLPGEISALLQVGGTGTVANRGASHGELIRVFARTGMERRAVVLRALASPTALPVETLAPRRPPPSVSTQNWM